MESTSDDLIFPLDTSESTDLLIFMRHFFLFLRSIKSTFYSINILRWWLSISRID